MMDIVEHLRDLKLHSAADEIERLQEENARLREALSKYGGHIKGCGHGWSCDCGFYKSLATKEQK